MRLLRENFLKEEMITTSGAQSRLTTITDINRPCWVYLASLHCKRCLDSTFPVFA